MPNLLNMASVNIWGVHKTIRYLVLDILSKSIKFNGNTIDVVDKFNHAKASSSEVQ